MRWWIAVVGGLATTVACTSDRGVSSLTQDELGMVQAALSPIGDGRVSYREFIRDFPDAERPWDALFDKRACVDLRLAGYPPDERSMIVRDGDAPAHLKRSKGPERPLPAEVIPAHLRPRPIAGYCYGGRIKLTNPRVEGDRAVIFVEWDHGAFEHRLVRAEKGWEFAGYGAGWES